MRVEISSHQYKAIMAIVSCFEGDDPVGDYGRLAVLDDGAGISYGKHQATENGGALHAVIAQYVALGGIYAGELAPYLSQLYDRVDEGRKDKLQLNGDMDFRGLLLHASNDPRMRRAQDDVFARDYYMPAVELAHEHHIYLPLGIAMAYEQAIQYGPATQRKLWDQWDADGFDPNAYYPSDVTIDPSLPFETQNQMRRAHYYNAQMREKRLSSSRTVVRKTVYRNDTIKALMQQGKWLLSPPFDVRVAYRTIRIDQAVLDRIP